MIDIMVVQKTRREHKCYQCGKVIPKGSCCLSGHGLDYDNQLVSERVHGLPENCFVDYLKSIEMMDDDETIEHFKRQLELVPNTITQESQS